MKHLPYEIPCHSVPQQQLQNQAVNLRVFRGKTLFTVPIILTLVLFLSLFLLEKMDEKSALILHLC
jgi:hypothetical protein